MYKIQVITQMGTQFSGYLFKDDKSIGGIGYDSSGLYVNLKEELTAKEMMLLMSYITTLNSSFGDIKICVNYIQD